jgi:ribose 5-phosphate isomerase B
MLRVLFATDHAGFEMKTALIPFVKDLGYEVFDMGAYAYDKNDDYPDFIAPCAFEVSKSDSTHTVAIILGASGQGEAIMANRFKGVRAVVYNGFSRKEGEENAKNPLLLTKEHNDANVLSLGARFLSLDEAKDAVRLWLSAPFSCDDRHMRRISKIDSLLKEYNEKK